MKNGKYVIGITCIGDEIGQAIVRSCRISAMPLLTVGIGKNPYAFGMYDCDSYEMTPSIYEENYLSILVQKCTQDKVDVLIPGHPDEVLLYSQNQQTFAAAGIRTIIPGEKLILICRDKETMADSFGSLDSLFVKSYHASEILDPENRMPVKFPLIAKPRTGFGSRSIQIIHTTEDVKALSDDFILQELAIPSSSDLNYERYLEAVRNRVNLQISEVSVQLVADKNGAPLGRMMSYNRLANGVPIEILPFDSAIVWEAIDSLLPYLHQAGLKGPLNIQGRLTEQGFKVFEMNPRFTAMTGVRALMGFNEVESCLRSWLDLPCYPLNINFNRFALRQTSDKVVQLDRNKDVQKHFFYINKVNYCKRRNILITGFNEPLGQHVVSALKGTDARVHILAWRKDRVSEWIHAQEVSLYSYADFEQGILSLGNIDTIIHLGFAGRPDARIGIAEGLSFSSKLFSRAVLTQVPAILNISSRSVYGRSVSLPGNELPVVSPRSSYASALYAVETMLQAFSGLENQVRSTSVRLPALSGGVFGFDPGDLIYKTILKVIHSQPVVMKRAARPYQILDLRDAAAALVRMLELPALEWQPVYDVVSHASYSLADIVGRVIEVAGEYGLAYPPALIRIEQTADAPSGFESSSFMQQVAWSPHYDLDAMVRSLFARVIGSTG